jgi:hypothetical protein
VSCAHPAPDPAARETQTCKCRQHVHEARNGRWPLSKITGGRFDQLLLVREQRIDQAAKPVAAHARRNLTLSDEGLALRTQQTLKGYRSFHAPDPGAAA